MSKILPGIHRGETVVQTAPCTDCGKKVGVKINKNGIAYSRCEWSDEYGATCGAQRRYSRVQSQKIQKRYVEQKGQKDGKETDNKDPETKRSGAQWHEQL